MAHHELELDYVDDDYLERFFNVIISVVQKGDADEKQHDANIKLASIVAELLARRAYEAEEVH